MKGIRSKKLLGLIVPLALLAMSPAPAVAQEAAPQRVARASIASSQQGATRRAVKNPAANRAASMPAPAPIEASAPAAPAAAPVEAVAQQPVTPVAPVAMEATAQAPVTPEAPPVAARGAKDPVYEAWEEFLKQRADAGAAAPGAGETKLESAELRQGGVQQGSLGAGPWGSLIAAVFGGVGLAGAYMARKQAPRLQGWLRTRAGNRKDRPKVRVISVSPLSAQGSIAVVEVMDEMLVLGVTSGRVSLLTRMTPNGLQVPAETNDDQEDAGALLRGAARPSSPKAQTGDDFSALLGNLMQEPETSPAAPASPLARYASLGKLSKDPSFEPPPEDMAGQVLRKMKTMKRFRGAA